MPYLARRSVFNYDEIPPGYYFDVLQKGSAVRRFWHREKFAAVIRHLKPDARILDVGCGPGSFLFMAKKTLPGLHCEGVDISSIQIDFAKTQVGPNTPGLVFRVIDSEHLPYEDASFDFVTTIEVLEHLHPYDAMKTAYEVRRVLKPNGEWLLTTPNYRSLWPLIEVGLNTVSPVKYHDQHISKFVPNSLVKFVEAGGFEVISLQTIFFLAPFFAVISESLAGWMMGIEKKLRLPGALLLLRCRPLEL